MRALQTMETFGTIFNSRSNIPGRKPLPYWLPCSAFTLVVVLCLPFGTTLANNCEATKKIKFNVPATALTLVELRALAGSLEIGPTTADQIEIDAVACTDSDKHLTMMDITFLMENGTLALYTVIPHHLDAFSPSHAAIDLQLRLPAKMPLKVNDTSGDLFARDIAIASIEDSSGDIDLAGGLVDLVVRDSSGDVKIRNLAGSLTITDSSGDLELDSIQGDVVIPADSSGSIEISQVTGKIDIDRDGSGDITIDDASGDVRIGSNGSGDIELEDIAGNATIEADGSGEIYASRIQGSFDVLAKGSGSIRTNRIQGKLHLPSD